MDHIDSFFFKKVVNIKEKVFNRYVKNEESLQEIINREIEKDKEINNEPIMILNLYKKYANLFVIISSFERIKKEEERKKKVISLKREYPSIYIPFITNILIKFISEELRDNNKVESKRIEEFLFKNIYEIYDKKKIYETYDALENKSVRKEISVISNFSKRGTRDFLIRDKINDSIFIILWEKRRRVEERVLESSEKLFNSKIVTPITKEVNRYHKDNFKTKSFKNKSKTVTILERYNEAIEENNPNIYVSHMKFYNIYYNKIEEINIFTKFLTDDGFFVKNIENRDMYIELKKLHSTRYFNFKKKMFAFTAIQKMVSYRLPRKNPKDFQETEVRNIAKNEIIDIRGFVIPSSFSPKHRKKGFVYLQNTIDKKTAKAIIEKKVSKNMFLVFGKDANIPNLLNEIFIIIKTEILNKIRASENMHMVSGLLKEYGNLITENEENNIYLEMYFKLKPGTPQKIPVLSMKEFPKKEFDVQEIDKKIVQKFENCSDNMVPLRSRPRVSDDERVYDISNYEGTERNIVRCIHILEKNYIESQKERNGFDFNSERNKLIAKYGIKDDIGIVCKHCFQKLGDVTEIDELGFDRSSYTNNIFSLSETNEIYEEDIIFIKKYILDEKLSTILKYPFLSSNLTARNNKNPFIHSFLEEFLVLINNHDLLKKENLPQLRDVSFRKNIYINAEPVKKRVSLIYISILILKSFTINDLYRLFDIDSACSFKNFQKVKIVLEKKYSNLLENFNKETFLYSAFILSCVQVKYILRVQDKKEIGNEILNFMINMLRLLEVIMKRHNVLGEYYTRLHSILQYKLQYVFKDSIIKKKKDKASREKNDNIKMYEVKPGVLEIRNQAPKCSSERRGIRNFKVRDQISYKDIDRVPFSKNGISGPSITKKKVKSKNDDNVMIINESFTEKTPSVSYSEFFKELNIQEESDSYFIDFGINGEPVETVFNFSQNQIQFVEVEKEKKISIFNSNCRCYMFFNSTLLYYEGYSFTNRSIKIMQYKKGVIYLKKKYSLKSKVKYLGYTHELYTFFDKEHLTKIPNLHVEINQNLKSIFLETHLFLLSLSRKKEIDKIENPKIRKSIKAIIDDSVNFVYENELNIKVLVNSFQWRKGEKPTKFICTKKELFLCNMYSNINVQYYLGGLLEVYKKNKRKKSVKTLIIQIISYMHNKYWAGEIQTSVNSNESLENTDVNTFKKEPDYFNEKDDGGEKQSMDYDEVDVDEELFEKDGDDQEVLYTND